MVDATLAIGSDRRFQIHRLPRRTTMHAAQPAHVGVTVGWKLPIIRSPNHRILEGDVVLGDIRPIARGPRSITGIDLTDVVNPIVYGTIRWVDQLASVGPLFKVGQIRRCIMHQRIIGLPGVVDHLFE